MLHILRSQCRISRGWKPELGGVEPASVPFTAIWDTGAARSVISENVVHACGLTQTGMARVQGVHGPATVETYFVNIALPNNITVAGIRATKGALLSGDDVLIGMDVISIGDFAVTNYDNATMFSFRSPSAGHIDFVAQAEGDEAE